MQLDVRPDGEGRGLAKCPTGIRGLDEILHGGIPGGRPTLVCGGPGCGKTMLAMEYLIHGAHEHGEPGLFVSFEEAEKDLLENCASLSFELQGLVADTMLSILALPAAGEDVVEAGEFDLEGLFLQLEQRLDVTGVRRLVLDSIDSLFTRFGDQACIRRELSRLFGWLRERGVTAVATSERGDGPLTRHGLEAHVADCVLLLDHRVSEQISKRRLRVVKYRGSSHGVDEYPFLIDESGISVLPITSVTLDHPVSSERVGSNIEGLDAMLGGSGYFKGSSILVSGTAGTGKSTLASNFAESVCQSGGRCLYLAFEESRLQLERNMSSVGLDLGAWCEKGLLTIRATRTTVHGLEEHLLDIQREIETTSPDAVVLDPITNFITVGHTLEIKSMLTRLLDFLRHKGITALLTSLSPPSEEDDETVTEVSSLIDTWLIIRFRLFGDERRRQAYVLKSRGMPHSHEIATMSLSSAGVVFTPPRASAARESGERGRN